MSRQRRKWFLVATLAAAAGLACLLGLPGPVKLRADDNEKRSARSWTFVVVSGETAPETTDRIFLDGAGSFDAQEGQVTGGGRFTRFTTTAPSPPVASGTFEVTDFHSFTPTTPPTWGAHAAGVLLMTVDLHPDGHPAIRGATMKVVCDLGFAGLHVGQMEGVSLTLPDGTTFQPRGAGLTVFGAGGSEN